MLTGIHMSILIICEMDQVKDQVKDQAGDGYLRKIFDNDSDRYRHLSVFVVLWIWYLPNTKRVIQTKVFRYEILDLLSVHLVVVLLKSLVWYKQSKIRIQQCGCGCMTKLIWYFGRLVQVVLYIIAGSTRECKSVNRALTIAKRRNGASREISHRRVSVFKIRKSRGSLRS